MADKIPLVFFRTSSGNEPVREWLKELPEDDRRAIGKDFERVQYRRPVGMPLARSLTRGLWELRADLAGNRIARIFSAFTRRSSWSSTASSRRVERRPRRRSTWRMPG